MVGTSSSIDFFLEQAGWINTTRILISADASFRRYERLENNGKTAILMDASSPEEDVGSFIRITEHLKNLGYSVPQIFAQDSNLGLLLLEDLGDQTFTNALAVGIDEKKLYQSAVNVLIDLHSRELSEAAPKNLEGYNDEKLSAEVSLFVDWYIKGIFGINVSRDIKSEFLYIWHSLLSNVSFDHKTLVLRDFHVDNLMWLPSRRGIRQCGLLDYQDALIGHPAYDLMSLFEDSRRDLKLGMSQELMDYYYNALPQFDTDEFKKVYSILSAQRHCKVIGIFSRLAMRDKKYGYLVHLPRCWSLLERVCFEPELKLLDDWLKSHIPIRKRSIFLPT